MMPLGDDDSARRTVPLVTYALIVLNVLFFFVELSGGDAFINRWAFVPSRFLANPVAVFKHDNAPPTFACLYGAHQARGAAADNNNVEWNH